MDTLKEVLKFFQSLGIANDSIFLILTGIGVAWLMWKQSKLFKLYHKTMSHMAEKMSVSIETLTKESISFSDRCRLCDKFHMGEHSSAQIQRETAKEKLDGIEDHCKEIKKQLLFKS